MITLCQTLYQVLSKHDALISNNLKRGWCYSDVFIQREKERDLEKEKMAKVTQLVMAKSAFSPRSLWP